MPDIFSDFPIRAAQDRVFQAVSTPEGLDSWWTKKAAGVPMRGAEFELGFGPGYDWRATVSEYTPPSHFELQIVRADPDWRGTHLGFRLAGRTEVTQVQFYHTGWPAPNEHWRISCYCWPIYLRILRRHLEHGEFVPYERRLEA